MAEGIEVRHSKTCRTVGGGRCNCSPTYRAVVRDRANGSKRIRSKPFSSELPAKQWRRDALNALAAGARPTGSGPAVTVGEALDQFLDGAREGRILNRSGDVYRPSTVRSYEQAARGYVKPALGHLRMGDVRRRDVLDFIEDMRGKGLAASTVHNKLDVLRRTFHRAISREEITMDPCSNLTLPKVRHTIRQVADRDRANELLDALPDAERALWTTLFLAGLRISEARALRWRDIDLQAGVLVVERGWDDKEGELPDPKTDAGKRKIPLAGRLKTELTLHQIATQRGPDDLCFGRTPQLAFDRATARRRARKAWGWRETMVDGRKVHVQDRVDALAPLTPHEARHTCASYLIAAGLNDVQLTQYIGHTDVRTTKNIYGHLFPDDAQNVAAALDTYLDAPRDARAT